jgi:methionyl-tRNA formyltransferase
MKIVFMGSAGFAVPSLDALVDSKHEILEVITQPDKPAGRGKQITQCPMAKATLGHGLKLYQPKSVKKSDAIEHIKGLAPDIIVVVAYGKILPNEILDIPPLECVNVHSSLLPKYRGAAPINWAIVKGETETGVTTQRITEKLDAGDILMQASTPIDELETASALHDRLSLMGADLLLRTLSGIEEKTIDSKPQNNDESTYAPIIKKEDGLIDWSKPAIEIFNRMRGFTPWPGTFTHLDGKTLRLHMAAVDETSHEEKPGTILEYNGDLCIACGEGKLYLIEVQIEGKRRMSAKDFLNGHSIELGTILK